LALVDVVTDAQKIVVVKLVLVLTLFVDKLEVTEIEKVVVDDALVSEAMALLEELDNDTVCVGENVVLLVVTVDVDTADVAVDVELDSVDVVAVL
jgi:hypothetical protein